MESLNYEVEFSVGREHLFATDVEAQSVHDAVAVALEEIGGASGGTRMQNPRHPLPEVEHGEYEVVGRATVFGRFRGARPVSLEIVEPRA